MSARTMLESMAVNTVLGHRLWDYTLRRQQAVQTGHETAELAGVLVQHDGSGTVETVRALLGSDGERVATPLPAAVDHAGAHWIRTGNRTPPSAGPSGRRAWSTTECWQGMEPHDAPLS